MPGLPPMAAFAGVRFMFAIACVFAPGIAARMIGESPAGLSPATKSFAALVATRASALGFMEVTSSRVDGELRRNMLTMISVIDSIDMITLLVRERQSRRLAPILAAVPLGVLSVYAHLRTAFKD